LTLEHTENEGEEKTSNEPSSDVWEKPVTTAVEKTR
jgi:hypothetical protein